MTVTDQENRLIKYYDGNATEDEAREIEAWIKMSDDNCKKAMDVYTLLLAIDTKYAVDNMDMENELLRLRKSMKGTSLRIPWWKWLQRFAAIMFLPMAVTIFVLLKQSDAAPETYVQMLEVQTPPGAIISFKLPDSTLVFLNGGSTLKYPSAFTDGSREVSLVGEAYFNVTKDTVRRFIVSTLHHSKVEVLGTRFNLEAFDDMDEVIATLMEGKVEFVYRQADDEHKAIMKPGQKIVYNKKNEQVEIRNTSGEPELAWKNKKVFFDRTLLEDALHMLAKRYNVEFVVKTSKYDRYTFTGAFTDQYVDEILENFRISSQIRWRNVKPANEKQGKRKIEIY